MFDFIIFPNFCPIFLLTQNTLLKTLLPVTRMMMIHYFYGYITFHGVTTPVVLHILFLLNLLFCIGVQPINNGVIVSGGQQSYSFKHIQVSILPTLPLIQASTLSRVPCPTQQVLVGFLYSFSLNCYYINAAKFSTIVKHRLWMTLSPQGSSSNIQRLLWLSYMEAQQSSGVL